MRILIAVTRAFDNARRMVSPGLADAKRSGSCEHTLQFTTVSLTCSIFDEAAAVEEVLVVVPLVAAAPDDAALWSVWICGTWKLDWEGISSSFGGRESAIFAVGSELRETVLEQRRASRENLCVGRFFALQRAWLQAGRACFLLSDAD